jgi:hypothetical protein
LLKREAVMTRKVIQGSLSILLVLGFAACADSGGDATDTTGGTSRATRAGTTTGGTSAAARTGTTSGATSGVTAQARRRP